MMSVLAPGPMEELLQALSSPASKERERECLALAACLLQVKLRPRSGATQCPNAAIKPPLEDRLIEEILKESNSPKLRVRLCHLFERIGAAHEKRLLLASQLAASLPTPKSETAIRARPRGRPKP